MRIFKALFSGLLFLFLLFSFSCSPAGTELGLVGTWKASNVSFNVSGYGAETANSLTLEITANDTGTIGGSYTGFATVSPSVTFKITKGDSILKTLALEYTASSPATTLVGLTKIYTYSLNGNQLKITNLEIWNDGANHTASKDVTFSK
jgi:hypothetical protein